MHASIEKADLDSTPGIRQFVDAFYARLLTDNQLAPIFIDVAHVDLAKHKPIICQYWEKLLLGDNDYQRHTMNIHRAINQKQTLQPQDFEQWLAYFVETVDSLFEGPKAERAKRVATAIAGNMEKSFAPQRQR